MTAIALNRLFLLCWIVYNRTKNIPFIVVPLMHEKDLSMLI
jgi:hypothetical protein